MKFFQDTNPPRVWDRVKEKVTVEFQEGEFETEDPAQVEVLIRAGYRYTGTLPTESSPEDFKRDKPKMERKKK